MGDLIRINNPLQTAPARPYATNDYLARHHKALQDPRGVECAIASFRIGLLNYGLQYAEEFEGLELGQDGVLGDAWLAMARGYLALLNGPTGRLDCGTLDGEVRRWSEKFGFNEKEREGL